MAPGWNAELYQSSHSFVWDFGRGVVELLAPRAGERILDIGCGSGCWPSKSCRVSRRLLALCTLLALETFAGGRLGDFYVVWERPGSVDVLEAVQAGRDTIVRLIRVGPEGAVLAAERRLAGTPPAFLAGEANPCDAAGTPDGSPSGLVARCGSRQVVVHASSAARRLAEAAEGIAFNEGDPLTGLSPAEQAAAARLGRALTPRLRSGRFDKALAGGRSLREFLR